MDLATKAKIRSQLAAKGIYWTDSQIEDYAAKNNLQPTFQPPPVEEDIFPERVSPEGGGFIENAYDFVGSALWNLADVGTFGIAGWVAPEAEEYVQRELMDTVGGRIGGTLGGLAGFMVPMGLAGRATSLAVRTTKGLLQGGQRAIRGGKTIANATTRQAQQMAAKKIMDFSQERALKTGGKALTWSEAKRAAVESSDDIIGFVQKPLFGSKILGKGFRKGPAYQMEHSTEFVNGIRRTLQATMPERLAANLSKRGVNLKPDQLKSLGDEVVELLATKPYNTIESIIAGKYSKPIAQSIANVVGAAGQEAINFGIVGTTMDFVQYKKGILDLTEHSFADRALGHLAMGAAFGGVKFVPGGTNSSIMKNMGLAWGRHTKTVNNSIKKMGLDETKALGRITLKNDKSAIFMIDGVPVNASQLRKGMGIGEGALPQLKTAMIEHNNRLLKDFRRPGAFPLDTAKDLAGSLPRMAAGALIFNYHSINDGAFEHLGHGEVAFHLGIGAIMTKGGRPLYKGGEVKTGFHFGERPHYYNSDLGEIYRKMNEMNLHSQHIGDIVKQFDGNLFTDWAARNPIQDAESIIQVLKDKDIVYDATNGKITPGTKGETALLNRELMDVISPVIGIMKSKSIEFNPNVSKEVLVDALKEIKLLKSESLSTPENPVYLSSKNIVTKSLAEGSQIAWTDLNLRVYDNFKQQIAAFTGQSDFVSPEGKMNDFYLPDTWKTLDPQDRMVINKLDKIKLHLKALDLIKVNDFSVGKGKGEKIELTPEKIKQLREIQDTFEFDLGKEFYGESFTEPIDLLDPVMWGQFHLVDHHRSVVRVTDTIMGRKVKGVEEVDSEGIQSLINEVLSHEDNRNHGIIVENPDKIDMKIPEESYDTAEYAGLNQFLKNLWAINAASGREGSDPRRVEVSMEKVKQLKEELVKIGMPDPVVHRLDGRMQDWVDRAVNNGIEEATRGLDLEPTKALAVKRMLLNGFVTLSTDTNNRGVALHAPLELTRSDILTIKPNATEAEIQSYIEAYNRVKENTKGVLTFREQFKLTGLNENQLGSIITADHIFNIDKLSDGIEKFSTDLDLKVSGVNNEIKMLEGQLMSVDGKSTAAEEIRSIMSYQAEIRNEINSFQMSFAKTLGGSVEISRASAHLELTQHMTSNGKTLMQHFDELSRAPKDEFQTRVDQIKDLQIAIANKVSERPDISTQFNEMRQEAVLKLKHEEIEGHMPSDNTRITPDLFLEKHNKRIEDVFQLGDQGHNKTYDSAAEAIYALYSETAIIGGNVDKFADRMFKLAGQDKVTASSELRNDIVHIAGLFERRYNVKRLVVNTSSGKGAFENTEISKGFLTDMYSEIFGLEQNADMILLSSDYMEGDFKRSFATNDQGLTAVAKALSGDFAASLTEGSVVNLKHFQPGRGISVEKGAEYYENIDLNKQQISGKHYVIGVDENINLVIPEAGFHSMAESYVKWYESIINSDYVKKARKLKAADDLFKNSLEPYYKRLKDIKNKDGRYEAEPFKIGYVNEAQHMEDAMYTIFNVMYGERIDADWLQDAYLTPESARKSYKYKRLAQNQGYTRNSLEKRQILSKVYAETSNKNYKDIIDTYTDKEFIHTLVINDGAKSITGEAVNNFITDNRSVAEANLKKQFDNKEINESDYKAMLESLKGHNSINAEAVNAMTAVRREMLDYLLLLNGQENLIGESAGQKPVGLSSFTDGNGVQHVFYNKTHYFYDSRLDNFFGNNKEIDQVAFKSGAKKAKVIDPKQSLENTFEPYDPPSMDSGQNIAEFINGISVNKSSKSVMPVKFDQTLSGAIYGKAHDVKVMKQFDNWSSKEVAMDMWEYARADLAQRFADVNVNLYNPEDTGLASREAHLFIRSSKGKDKEGISTEVPNASVASIWMEADGVPFSEISKNLYDALIKRKYIDDAGVFDGYTDAGGRPILRGNLTNDLNIPVFANGIQVKLGEAKIGEDYLDRDIHFLGSFGVVSVDKPGKIKRPSYRDKATLTIAFNHEGRDVIVDLKSNTIIDPSNPKAKIGDYKEIKKMVDTLKGRLESGELLKYRDVFNELQTENYTGAQLAIMAMPAPRTGPHDAMVVKIKEMLPSKDGGIMELNPYDVTMRGQRDFDTDELAFYMDTPFSAVKESYRKGGDILEPLPESNKLVKDLDMFSNKSYKDYNQNMQEYQRKRGPVVKMHRKLTYAKRLFDEIGSLKLDDNTEIVFTKDTKAAVQGLVSDSQNVLDIYDGTPNSMKNINDWTDAKLFGNNPFFKLKVKKDGKTSETSLDETAYRLIVKKVLNDFGSLLNLEGSIWQGGEAKKPRYQDMVSAFRDFQAEYSRDRVNWNFYHYLTKKDYGDVANKLFFKNDAPRKDADMVGDIMGALSEQVLKNPTPFMKSLDTVAKRDFNRVRETYRPEGDYFNKGIDQLLGRQRALALEYFRETGELTNAEYSKAEDAIEGLWKSFYKLKDHEGMMVQANTIQEQIRRSEWKLSETEKNPNADPVSIEMQKENLFIKNESLQYLLNRMAIEPDAFGQELIRYKKDMKPIKNFNNDIVIRDAKTGKFKERMKPDSEHWLKANEVAVKNPVILRAVVEHELLDGIAFANSTLGYYSHVRDGDMVEFRKIVANTKREIKQSMMQIMKEKSYRDWTSHQTRALMSIEKGLAQIKKLAINNAVNDAGAKIQSSSTFFGEMPMGRETYGIDFLMSMLVPDHTGNPNERYFSPKTGNMMHPVEAPKRSVINAVFQAMEQYQVHASHKEFVQNFAKTHRGFYDALVAGRGFHEGMHRLAESNFEGALLKTTIDKAMHNPFMTRTEFKSLAETFEMTPDIKSDYAEMFRQIIQDGALTDPQTAFNLRRLIIENPALGKDTYNAIFQLSRGQIVFDGLSSRQVGIHQGEGQLLGEVLMTRRDMIQRSLIGKKPVKDGIEVKDMLNTVIGVTNEIKLGNCD